MLMIFLGTLEGARIDLQHISIEPCKSATIQYTLINKNGESSNHTYKMEGEQYARWGNDDTIIYHLLCAKHGYHYKPFEEPEFFEEVMVWKDEATGEMKSDLVKYPNPKYKAGGNEDYKPLALPTTQSGMTTTYEDTRSVHNEADIQKIQSLQEQLDSQALKLKTLTDMLIGKGLV
jgi:hypothetical protein